MLFKRIKKELLYNNNDLIFCFGSGPYRACIKLFNSCEQYYAIHGEHRDGYKFLGDDVILNLLR